MSLVIFAALFGASLFSECIANDKPLLLYYDGAFYFPVLKDYSELRFGGEFDIRPDYREPFTRDLIRAKGWFVMPPLPFSYNTIDYALPRPAPAPPSAEHIFGTDDRGRDVAARLLYAFRISALFGLSLTLFSSLAGVALGAAQGFYGGAFDIVFQRFIEVWSGLPALFMLIILSSAVEPGFFWLLGITLLFGWMTLAGVVRAEFLRARNFEYVLAARAMGMKNGRIMFRHILPNALSSTLSYLPFILGGSITTLTSLDFLGFGLPPGSPSLGELLSQGKANLQAPWLGVAAFAALALTLILLVFIGEAARDAFDPRALPPRRARKSPARAEAGGAGAGTEAGGGAADGGPLVRYRDFHAYFLAGDGEKEAACGVNFEIRAGETLALVGESGSGKTVSAQALLRLRSPGRVRYAGEILFDGENVLALGEAALRRIRGKTAGMIFQEPMTSLNPLHTVEKQLAESIALHRGLGRARARPLVVDILERVGLRDAASRLGAYPHELSGGERQRVMIALALVNKPKLLIADEPTTALDVTTQARILALVRRLQREMGLAVLFITHDLRLVRGFAARVAVMKDGRVVEEGATERVFAAPAHPYTALLLEDAAPRDPPAPRPGAPAVLEARGLSVRYPLRGGLFRRARESFTALDNLSFTLRRGEALGVAGESGSGKSTLARALVRLAPSSGEVLLSGAPVPERGDGLRAARRRMQIIFQDPFGSLSPRMTVRDIVGEGLLIHEKIGARERDERVRAALAEAGLEGPGILDRYPAEFSGGQRQRVAIARGIVLKPEVLILDEPTSGLDRAVQRRVIALLESLRDKYAISCLFISHDLDLVRGFCAHALIMRKGVCVERGPTAALFAAPQTAYARELIAASGGGSGGV